MTDLPRQKSTLTTYVIDYVPGPAWLKGKPICEQQLGPHRDYMMKLVDEGTMLMGGPFTDNSGGMTIVRVRDDEHLKAIIDDDPAIRDKVFIATAKAWQIVFAKPGR